MDVLRIFLLQFVVYALLARLAFRVATRHALGLALARIVTGSLLFWMMALLVLSGGGTWDDPVTDPRILLLASAVMGWLLVAVLDPKPTLRRGVAWVLVGTLVSMALNLTLLERSDSDFHWAFG